MSIRCGKGHYHDTVAEVRDCYEVVPEGTQPDIKNYRVGIKEEISRVAEKLPLVDKSHYAVEIDGELKFYQVDRPREGKWKGFLFLKVQASDETFPIKSPQQRLRILTAIAEDYPSAMRRYVQEIGRCCICNRTLTNEDSRAFGIGPICRSKVNF